MAQYTVSLDPVYGSQAELRICKPGTKEAVTFTIRNGETIVSDDVEFVRALASLVGRDKPVLTTLASKPASPTHDVDTKTRQPAPDSGTKVAVERVK